MSANSSLHSDELITSGLYFRPACFVDLESAEQKPAKQPEFHQIRRYDVLATIPNPRKHLKFDRYRFDSFRDRRRALSAPNQLETGK